MKKTFVFTLLVLIVFTTDAQQLQTIFDAEAAYAKKDYSRYIELGELLLKKTTHPNILYRLAQSYAATGVAERSIDYLKILADKGVAIDPSKNDVFQNLRSSKRFQDVVKQFASNMKTVEKSVTAFTLPDKQLIPEGIATDENTGDFFLSSLSQWKVVKRNNNGTITDFADAARHGLWSTLGMKVDPARNELWVCSESEMDTLNGYSGIFVFDLSNSRLKKKIVLDNKHDAHLFNDIVIDKSGTAYFTDSKAGKLFCIRNGSDNIEEVASGFLYPNGIAIDDKEKNLYIADFTGLTRIDLNTKALTRINDDGKTFLEGIDGLVFYKNCLIAIQDSGNNDDRVVRFYLDKSLSKIEKTEVLQSYRPDFVIPTTGVIYKDAYYYIANSYLRNLTPDRKILQPEILKEPLILKISLQ